MNAGPSTRARRVLAALLRIGWTVKRQSGSHRTLSRQNGPISCSRFTTTRRSGHAYLPTPKKASKVKMTEFTARADPEMAARIVHAADTTRLERVRADSERHPSRLLANALVNTAWRNGSVEDIHAGEFRGYPLDQRRVTPAEERELMGFASERLALGMRVCRQLAREQPRRPWSEQVLPYGLAESLMITPSRWTLTEPSCEVRLPAAT
jgi:site-specific DNA-cytosine methylase